MLSEVESGEKINSGGWCGNAWWLRVRREVCLYITCHAVFSAYESVPFPPLVAPLPPSPLPSLFCICQSCVLPPNIRLVFPPPPSISPKMSDLTTSTETTLTTSSFGDVIVERDVVKVRRYRWPELLLSIILLTLFVCGTVVLGSFSYFTYIQQKLFVPIPWFVLFIQFFSPLVRNWH